MSKPRNLAHRTLLVGSAVFAAMAGARPAVAAAPDEHQPVRLVLPMPGGLLAGGDDCVGATNLTGAFPCDGNLFIDEPVGMTTANPSGGPAGSCWFEIPAPTVDNDRWYRWTNNTGAPQRFHASTDFNENSSGDSQLAIYDDCSSPAELACSEDDGVVSSVLALAEIVVMPTQTIFIQIDGWMGDNLFDRAGFYCETTARPGDDCSDPVDIGLLSPDLFSPVVSLTGEPQPTGASDYGELDAASGNPLDQPETCYAFTATTDGWVQIAASPTHDNSRVILSSDGGLNWEVSKKCWSDPLGGDYDTAPQHGTWVTAATDYCFCIDSWGSPVIDDAQVTSYDLDMYYWEPGNDTNVDCASSEELDFCASTVVDKVGLSTVGAGQDPGIPPDMGCGADNWSGCSGDGTDLNYHLTWTQGMVDCGCDSFQVSHSSPLLGGLPYVCDAAIQIATDCPPTPASCVASVDNGCPVVPGVCAASDESTTVGPLGIAEVGTTYNIQLDSTMASACPNFEATFELLGCMPGCDLCNLRVPDVAVTACPLVDDCMGSSDGGIDPRDVVSYTITFRNSGTGTATDFQAEITATGAMILAGGTVGGGPPLNIPFGSSYNHTLEVLVTAMCGEDIDIDVVNMRSGGFTFADDLATCDATVESPPNCVDCCAPLTPAGSIDNVVRAVRNGNDLDLSWVGATVVPADYRAYGSRDKTKLPETTAELGSQSRLVETDLEAWSHPGVVPLPTGLLYYKVLPGDSCGGTIFPCDLGPCWR